MASKLIKHIGRRGDAGANALNASGVGDIRESIVSNAIVDVLKYNRESDVSFEREGEAVYIDRYGVTTFVDGSDITNKCLYSNDFSNAVWQDASTFWTLTDPAISDPDGGSDASLITLDLDSTATNFCMDQTINTMSASKLYTVSFYIKNISGVSDVYIKLGVEERTIPITTSWERVSVSLVSGSVSALLIIIPRGAVSSTVGIYQVQVQEGSNATDYIDTTSAEVTVENPNSPARVNASGYLIEGVKTNELIYSEYLAALDANLAPTPWSVAGANLST